MDASIRRIAEYATGFSHAMLPAGVVHECRRHLVDTIGCVLGGWDAEPCAIARNLAARSVVPGGSRVLGGDVRTLPELAAFANGVMARYLDGNDVYPGGGGHPSDVVAAVLAVADARGADGKTLFAGIVLAYEIYSAFYRAAVMRAKGLDHVFYTAVAGAAGAARMLGLDVERTGQAISLAVTPNLALHATRRGDLSMWKGVAAGNAARNGVFAALLAEQGMTGPDRAIDGSHGLRELLGGFELGAFTAPGGAYALTRADIKFFLTEFHSQAPITVALDLHRRVRAEDIESITVHTYWFARDEIGSEPEKWHPTTRESADHSLPYILSAVLIDGAFSDAIFTEERIADPRIHALADRIVVEEDPAYTRAFPARIPCRIEIRTKQGESVTGTVDHPRGHTANPMTDAEIEEKFVNLAGRRLPAARVRRALDVLWALDAAPGLDGLFDAVRLD